MCRVLNMSYEPGEDMEEILSSRSESYSYRKTKIIATLGPASRSPENLRELIISGVNVFRLNFSHGSHEEHLETLKRVRAVSSELGIPVAILQDLSGPKIRITEIQDDYAPVRDADEIFLKHAKGEKSSAGTLFIETLNPVEFLKLGEQVLLADGLLELRCVEILSDKVRCEVSKGGRIRSRVGIAFPDSDIDLPATTDKDYRDLAWGIQHDVDYVAISFVNTAEDIIQLREEITRQGGHSKLIAKIERKSALRNIEGILEACDGLMVARGDLGLELPLEKVPRVQKALIEKANYRGIPVIVATQMLHSMVTSIRPTRAEASDIATAVMSGADALMLSDETAIGENPILAVKNLGKIAFEAEREFDFSEYKLRLKEADSETIPDAVSYAASAAAIKVKASALVACTETGSSARLIAKYRPQQPLFGASSSERTIRRMCLYWGVRPVHFRPPESHERELETALEQVKAVGNFSDGERAVITSGLRVRTPGSTSLLQIRNFKANNS
ncbi:pyruvate kinase [bacterium]|nr:pyruvate kinase [bacterium]